MTWLLILLIVALALAPLLHFAPSKRQRRIARLREQAALQGLFVEFRALPAGAAARTGGGVPPIYYGKRLPPAARGTIRKGCWIRSEEGWRGLELRAAVPAPLADLPLEVSLAGLDTGSCGIYWHEAGDEHNINHIRAVLDAWAESLLC